MPAIENSDVGDQGLDDDLELIGEAARAAGLLALDYYKNDPKSWLKAGHSPVSEADMAVDALLSRTLLSARPDYGWMSEETIDDPLRLSRDTIFVVDPIDGTRAFLKGDDRWCVSVALVRSGRPVAGIVFCPALGEFYTAARNRGAYLNGNRLSVSRRTGRLTLTAPQVLLKRLSPSFQDNVDLVPAAPSLAYRLAHVADGRLDATFVRATAQEWDIAAADLMLHEAGGALVDMKGDAVAYNSADPSQAILLASGLERQDELLRLMRASFADG